MARVTVEDCLDNVENRFQLVLVAARRARQLMAGSEPFVERENDKPTVLALREIAGGFVTSAILEESETQEAGLDVNEITLSELVAASGETTEVESSGKKSSAAADKSASPGEQEQEQATESEQEQPQKDGEG